LTSGLIEAVREVGPSTPMAKRGFDGSRASAAAQQARASFAAS